VLAGRQADNIGASASVHAPFLAAWPACSGSCGSRMRKWSCPVTGRPKSVRSWVLR